jgi:cellulose synthase/poly-beta-1,6-N-acetylglucosamine synthase-like glycosyltransferase
VDKGIGLTARLQAHKQGFKFGWIPCIAREQSPQTITDYIKQRRRWYKGILTLGDPVGYLSIATWTWPLLVPSMSMLCLLISRWPKAITSWCVALLALHEAVRICGLSLALFIQDLDARVGCKDMLWHQALCLLLAPILWILDATAILSAWVDMPSGFEVISK